ncbi:hypothetical protein L5470_10115 [Synechococcus sp. PCC 6717]|jgi:SulP family sulfate permease|uniref:Uncharacterized protein n=1 Tax=Parathermosynechococcus lividus PCC 6715 TaxID=1917166 RepID=A0A2D2Q2S9_PARLV|nr:hypothetical protein [Thermostichus lividus]ATS18798.1 hypothetical protein BRW62_08605 [Thermostichus lividus PCC 6715]MCI3281325.1 hypothetical protein [Synechococcus sp. PCC 6717]
MSLINPIHFCNWRGDLFGSLTTAIVALLLALVFGMAMACTVVLLARLLQILFGWLRLGQ